MAHVTYDASTRTQRLATLDLRRNQLEYLPVRFVQLGALETLLLDGNPLYEPPPSVAARGVAAMKEHLEATRRSKTEELLFNERVARNARLPLVLGRREPDV